MSKKIKTIYDDEIEKISRTLLRKTEKDKMTNGQRRRMKRVSTIIKDVSAAISEAKADTRKRNFKIDK